MTKLLLLFMAGGMGTLLRYGANHWTRQLVEGTLAETIHVWTIVVNVLGCLFIGLLTPLLTQELQVREEWRLAILVGLLGGFTTFSTFGFELFGLLEKGHAGRAAVYALSSVTLGLGAVWLGWTIAGRLGATPGGA
ncbi:MAG: fluoride efflux transporter CrcB [Phycisphaerales bacterium JB059]